MPPWFPPASPPSDPVELMMCERYASRDLLQIQPWMDDWEQQWPTGIRIVIYGLQLCWAFMGVSIIADIFMAAIEEITMATYIKKDAKTGKMKVFKKW